MKALVVGFGSIGARHARLLDKLGHGVSVVSHHGTSAYSCYKDLKVALKDDAPDYVVIASPTTKHHQQVCQLAEYGFLGTVLVEKPLFHRFNEIPRHEFRNLFVAYNFRFHPILEKLKTLLIGQSILTVHAYAGQYLPDWRPGQQYHQCYSVSKNAGGGVLRDLSHELDYVTWLLGGWNQVTAIGGHYSHLKGDSEDAVGLLLKTPLCPMVMIHLNYLDRGLRRELIINTDEHTYKVDFVKGVLFVDEESTLYRIERDDTYREQHIVALRGNDSRLCSATQALEVVSLIESAEQAIQNNTWVVK